MESYPRFEVIVIDQSDGHVTETREFLAAWSRKMTYVTARYKNLSEPATRVSG